MILVPVVNSIAGASWLPPSIIIRALESLCLPLGIMESNWKVARLDGILFILRTGAPWIDLPDQYPPYQTCHRRFQQWVRSGVMRGLLEALAEDLRLRGGFCLHEAFIDGSFALAKKGCRRGQDQARQGDEDHGGVG